MIAPFQSQTSILCQRTEKWRLRLTIGMKQNTQNKTNTTQHNTTQHNTTQHTKKKGSKCDVLDSVGKWYTATVIDVDDNANRVKVNYDQWSHRYDEWKQQTQKPKQN